MAKWIDHIVVRVKDVEQGLRDYLTVLQQEIAATMALMGVNRIDEVGVDLLDPD